MAMVFGQSQSQDTEQDGEIQVNEAIAPALSAADTEPINLPVSLLNANLKESKFDS